MSNGRDKTDDEDDKEVEEGYSNGWLAGCWRLFVSQIYFFCFFLFILIYSILLCCDFFCFETKTKKKYKNKNGKAHFKSIKRLWNIFNNFCFVRFFVNIFWWQIYFLIFLGSSWVNAIKNEDLNKNGSVY